MNWFDGLIILLISLFAFWGYRAGIIKMGFRLFGTLFSFLLSFMLHPIFRRVLSQSAISKSVNQSITKWINTLIAGQQIQTSVSNSGDTAASQLISAFPFPQAMKESLIAKSSAEIAAGTENTIQVVSSAVASALTGMILSILAFIIVLVSVKLIMLAIELSLKGIFRLPVLKGANKLLGFGLGALEGILLMYIIAVFLTIFNSGSMLGSAHVALQTSLLGQIFYHNNFILKLFFA